MTCIVGIEAEGRVVMGGDSCCKASNGYIVNVAREPKVFFLGGDILIGSTGTAADPQALQYGFRLPARPRKRGFDFEAYLGGKLLPCMRTFYKSLGRLGKDDDSGRECLATNFLIAFGGALYYIDGGFAFSRYGRGFAAIGQGEDVALGALRASLRWEMTPEERIELALEQADYFCDGVAGPFAVLST